MKTKQNLLALCECGVMVALAVALSFLKLPWFWVNGGSVDLVCIPLILIGYRRGFCWGVGSGLVYGLIDCLIGAGIGYGLLSVLLDYVLAYGAVGLAGLFHRRGLLGLEIGAVVGCVARFLIHFFAGITIWKIAVGDTVELFGKTFGSDASIVYSILYNGSFMLPNLLLALIILPILYPALKKLEKMSPLA